MTFRGLARKLHSSAPRFSTEVGNILVLFSSMIQNSTKFTIFLSFFQGGQDGIINLAGQLLKNPLFQFGGVLVSVMYAGASSLHGEIKGLHGDIKSAEAKLEATLKADRKEAAVDRRQMQATLNEILKTQRRSWW